MLESRYYSLPSVRLKSSAQRPHKLLELSPWKEKEEDDPSGSQRRRVEYTHLEVIQPAWTDELKQEMKALSQQAEQAGILPSLNHSFKANKGLTATLPPKAERLKTALWLFKRLSPAKDAHTALNQLACALDWVETRTRQNAIQAGIALPLGTRFFSLPRAYSEICHGQALQVSHAVRHIILVSPNGAVQIQQAPGNSKAVDYLQNAHFPNTLLLTKSGIDGAPFWSAIGPAI